MNHDEALRYLASIEGLGIKLALQNVTQVLSRLGEPQRRFPSVLISGTNGKGSVAAMLASILRRAGKRTGLYTSPHLIRHEERIVVDGRPIAETDFAEAVTRVHEAVQDLLDAGRLEAHPTHFETLTAAAFDHFARAEVEFAVLEVGMGGRLDATVLARPRLSIITNVDLEHTAFLGSTVRAIAEEKAGILPEGGILLTGETREDALDPFRARARLVGGRLIEMREFASVRSAGPGRVSVRTPRRQHVDLAVGLKGPHQIGNAALAVAACDILDTLGFSVSDGAIRVGLGEANWPGRFQIVEGDPPFIFDGAHNPAACLALRAALDEFTLGRSGRVTLLFGVLRDKDHEPMMRALFPAARCVVLTRGTSERFHEPHALRRAAEAAMDGEPRAGSDGSAGLEESGLPRMSVSASISMPAVIVTESLEDGLREARSVTPPGGAICVCGSLYLVGDTMRALGVNPWP